MARPEFALKRSILTQTIKKAYRKVKPKIPSRTLRQALRWEVTPRPRAFLEVPHYWAVYYHEGVRGPIRPRRSKYLVWFQKAKDDPRLNNGVGPVRGRDIRRLTKQQWEDGLRRNYLRRRRGLRPFMIVVRSKRGFRGVPFFNRAFSPAGFGSGGLIRDMEKIAIQEFDKYLKGLFKRAKLKPSKQVVIKDKVKL